MGFEPMYLTWQASVITAIRYLHIKELGDPFCGRPLLMRVCIRLISFLYRQIENMHLLYLLTSSPSGDRTVDRT